MTRATRAGQARLVVAEAHLLDGDAQTRRQRAHRLVQVQHLHAALLPGVQVATAGGNETLWLVEEAKVAYIAELFLAALVTAHAACERELAGRLALRLDDQVPGGWERWGLGKLVEHAQQEGSLQSEVVELLLDVNERRKSLVHYRRPVDVGSYERRYVDLADQVLPGMEPTLDEMWADDALLALRAALTLLVSNPFTMASAGLGRRREETNAVTGQRRRHFLCAVCSLGCQRGRGVPPGLLGPTPHLAHVPHVPGLQSPDRRREVRMSDLPDVDSVRLNLEKVTNLSGADQVLGERPQLLAVVVRHAQQARPRTPGALQGAPRHTDRPSRPRRRRPLTLLECRYPLRACLT